MNQIIGAAIIGAVIYLFGHHVGYADAEDKYKDAIAKAKAQIEEQRHESERVLADAITKRDEQINSARADADSLRRVVERLRRSTAGGDGRAAGNDPCVAPRASLARCERLLGEGLELLAEGGELLRKHAADHDALIKLK